MQPAAHTPAITLDDINASFVINKRKELGNMTQSEFWASLGFSRSTGSRCEDAKYPIPEATRRLIYFHYVLNFPTDFNSEQFNVLAQKIKES